MNDQPYQLLPPLSAEEYAALREDIAAHGIRVPVDVDEAGQILDGHHRAAIAAELGIPYPTRMVAGLTEDEKRHHALAVNVQRRQLSRQQRRALVVAELERDPSRSDRAIGRVVGVDHKTVAAIRRGGWGIPHVEISDDDLREFEENEAQIQAGVDKADTGILVALLRGIPPIEIVGKLAATQHRFEQEYAQAGEDFLSPVRRHLFGSRIAAVLAWPGGWYAEDACRERDELYEHYVRATGRTTPGGAA